MRNGFILSIEALMSLVVALLLVLAIGFARGARENPYETLYEHQLLNDVFEVCERSGACADVGAWAEGDEAAGERAREKLEEIASYSSRCIEAKIGERRITAGCERLNAHGIIGSRILVVKNEYKKLGIEMRAR
ncbi:MAG: hypothetical protein AB1468_02305 [Candidatus Micrarchaeota archaeon]